MPRPMDATHGLRIHTAAPSALKARERCVSPTDRSAQGVRHDIEIVVPRKSGLNVSVMSLFYLMTENVTTGKVIQSLPPP